MRLVTRTSSPVSIGGVIPNGGTRKEDCFERRFDPEMEEPSDVVLEAVAFIHNTDPSDLDPLYDVIAPDELDGLIGSCESDHPLEVVFCYEGLVVRVTSEGDLWLTWDD